MIEKKTICKKCGCCRCSECVERFPKCKLCGSKEVVVDEGWGISSKDIHVDVRRA